MTYLCFVCNDGVINNIDDTTRDKYRDVIGVLLVPDSQLCYICCHVLHKLWMFKTVCLERSLEHPTLQSKKCSIKLQKSDLEIHILCPEKCYEHKQLHSNKSYQYNEDSNDYNSQYINNVVYIQNDNQYIDNVNDDFEYIDRNNQYTNHDNLKLNCNEHGQIKRNTITQFNYDVNNDFEYIDKDKEYTNNANLKVDSNEHTKHTITHVTMQQFNYDANNDFEYIDKDNQYINDDILKLASNNHNIQHVSMQQFNYDANNDFEYIDKDNHLNDNNAKLECDAPNNKHNSMEQIKYDVTQTNINQDSKNDQSIDDDMRLDDQLIKQSVNDDTIDDNHMIESNNQQNKLTDIIENSNLIYDNKIENDNTEILEAIHNINLETNHNNDKLDISKQEDIEENVDKNSDSEKKIKKKSSKVFKRIILSLEKQKAELEANRKKKKYMEAEFKCYNCALSFLFKDTYQVHMMRHEESNGEYVCPACTLRFASPALLRVHVAGHAERHACRRCGEVLRPRARRKHPCASGTPPQQVACHLCGNLLKDANGLQQHLKRVHANKVSARRYACNVCGDSYTRQGALRTHMIKHINRKFPCELCARSYSSPYTLAQHKRTHHAAPLTHHCDTCGAGYGSRKSLLAHMRNTSNHSTTTYECPICSRVCPNQKSLASHIQCVHSSRKDYACALCPARYTSRKSLVRHALAHTGRAPARVVVCHLCGNHFKDNSKLNRHIREVCKKAKEEQMAVYS
ncbi:PR domain zinc finger protein 5 isoform X1 [Bicyclus anynana]|uniref:PR domain zinc finger protein 5 isoform X1 n=2 Tax=Bicyclus anynana TaxID=110368 RepID=A0A6J1NN40_BICAN|nr:PR domain zinc finger protein 5 isoform X1 [Bicyclus anynana]